MKILYLTNIPSPYRVAFFNELGKRCDLTVIFEKSNSIERNDSWKQYSFDNFEGIILNGVRVRTDAAICPSIIRFLSRKKYDYIIVTNMSSPTGILAVAWLQLLKIPYCIEGDGAFAGNGKGLKEKLKKWIISNAKMWLSTSQEHDKYYLTYGANKEHIYRYPFTSVFKKDVLEEPLKGQQKEAIKKELGISEKYIILSVGAFIPRKGFDILMKAIPFLPEEWGVYLVGGKPTEEYLKIKSELDLNRLHFVEFQKTEKLKEYYAAADLYVFPTREDIWGLVINEALAYGLPVVTTNRCIAGLELIRDGYNGAIVESESIDDLLRGMKNFLDSEEYRERCAQNALNVMQQYTMEKMVESHISIWS